MCMCLQDFARVLRNYGPAPVYNTFAVRLQYFARVSRNYCQAPAYNMCVACLQYISFYCFEKLQSSSGIQHVRCVFAKKKSRVSRKKMCCVFVIFFPRVLRNKCLKNVAAFPWNLMDLKYDTIILRASLARV